MILRPSSNPPKAAIKVSLTFLNKRCFFLGKKLHLKTFYSVFLKDFLVFSKDTNKMGSNNRKLICYGVPCGFHKGNKHNVNYLKELTLVYVTSVTE